MDRTFNGTRGTEVDGAFRVFSGTKMQDFEIPIILDARQQGRKLLYATIAMEDQKVRQFLLHWVDIKSDATTGRYTLRLILNGVPEDLCWI